MTVRSMRATVMQGQVSQACRRVETRLITPADEHSAEAIAQHIALARAIYAERRRRHKFLPADLFAEPTWDILLDLYIAAREDRRVPTTSACIGAHVPPTTALRWLRILEARALVEREDDGRDGRRTFVRLTAQGLVAMDRSLASFAANFGRLFGADSAKVEASPASETMAADQ